MARITAKYSSSCGVCGQRITPGDAIEYQQGTPTRHADCAPVALPPDAIHLSIGQGYARPGFAGWSAGDVIVNDGRRHGSSAARTVGKRAQQQVAWERAHPRPQMAVPRPQWYALDREQPDFQAQLEAAVAAGKAWDMEDRARVAAWEQERTAALAALCGTPADDDGPPYLYVLTASQRYVREDGMSFGVGDEQGFLYEASCRAATDEESAPLRAAQAEACRRTHARQALKVIERQFVDTGEYVEGSHILQGEQVNIGRGQDLYGGGSWFVLQPDWIWYVLNNGMDGDDWAANNVRTGGAGGIGRRLPATPDLAAQIRDLVATAWPKEHRHA